MLLSLSWPTLCRVSIPGYHFHLTSLSGIFEHWNQRKLSHNHQLVFFSQAGDKQANMDPTSVLSVQTWMNEWAYGISSDAGLNMSHTSTGLLVAFINLLLILSSCVLSCMTFVLRFCVFAFLCFLCCGLPWRSCRSTLHGAALLQLEVWG